MLTLQCKMQPDYIKLPERKYMVSVGIFQESLFVWVVTVLPIRCRAGLGTILQEVFVEMRTFLCRNYRLGSAFQDTVKKEKQYDKMMTLLTGLHYYCQYHKQKQGLLETFKALDINGLLPPKVTGTRWLPHVSRGINSSRENNPT